MIALLSYEYRTVQIFKDADMVLPDKVTNADNFVCVSYPIPETAVNASFLRCLLLSLMEESDGWLMRPEELHRWLRYMQIGYVIGRYVFWRESNFLPPNAKELMEQDKTPYSGWEQGTWPEPLHTEPPKDKAS